MDSVSIVMPAAEEQGFLELISKDPRFRLGAHGWVAQDDGRQIYVSRNDFAAQELSRERLGRIRQAMTEPVFYALDYNDITLCRAVLTLISMRPGLLIDTDHGQLLSSEQLAWRLSADPRWDWRRKSTSRDS